MPDKLFAGAHPGKLGDSLYSLPSMRKIYRDTGVQFDFYTSSYCSPLVRLMEYQECINKVIIPEEYVIKDFGCGVQPWEMPIDASKYERVYQFGFRSYPAYGPLHQYMYKEATGSDEALAIEYECPEIDKPYFNDNPYFDTDYIVLAPGRLTSHLPAFRAFAERHNCVIIGAKGENFGIKGWNELGLDMLETCSVLKRSKGFIGLFSSQLVLANGFPIKRVGVHENNNDMSHVIHGPHNIYLVHPTAEDLERALFN